MAIDSPWEDLPLFLFYPSLDLIFDEREKLILPNIRLPPDYRERVPIFYERKGKEKIEEYMSNLMGAFKDISAFQADMRLNWTEDQGLRNIRVGIHGGLDLSEERSSPRFEGHNLEWLNAIPPFFIATTYVRELLKVK